MQLVNPEFTADLGPEAHDDKGNSEVLSNVNTQNVLSSHGQQEKKISLSVSHYICFLIIYWNFGERINWSVIAQRIITQFPSPMDMRGVTKRVHIIIGNKV